MSKQTKPDDGAGAVSDEQVHAALSSAFGEQAKANTRTVPAKIYADQSATIAELRRENEQLTARMAELEMHAKTILEFDDKTLVPELKTQAATIAALQAENERLRATVKTLNENIDAFTARG